MYGTPDDDLTARLMARYRFICGTTHLIPHGGTVMPISWKHSPLVRTFMLPGLCGLQGQCWSGAFSTPTTMMTFILNPFRGYDILSSGRARNNSQT